MEGICRHNLMLTIALATDPTFWSRNGFTNIIHGILMGFAAAIWYAPVFVSVCRYPSNLLDMSNLLDGTFTRPDWRYDFTKQNERMKLVTKTSLATRDVIIRTAQIGREDCLAAKVTIQFCLRTETQLCRKLASGVFSLMPRSWSCGLSAATVF